MSFEDSSRVLVALFFSRASHLCNFGGGYHTEQFCEIILNFDEWFRCRLKNFLSIAPAALMTICNCGRWHYGEHSCEITLICNSGSGKKKVYGRRTKPITIAHLEPFNVIITRLYVIGDVIKIKQAVR